MLSTGYPRSKSSEAWLTLPTTLQPNTLGTGALWTDSSDGSLHYVDPYGVDTNLSAGGAPPGSTDWTLLPVAAGWAATPSFAPMQYRRLDANTCVLFGNAQLTSSGIVRNKLVCTLPAGFTPQFSTIAACSFGETSPNPDIRDICKCEVRWDGSVLVTSPTSGTAGSHSVSINMIFNCAPTPP